jgi:hypothetical protein
MLLFASANCDPLQFVDLDALQLTGVVPPAATRAA